MQEETPADSITGKATSKNKAGRRKATMTGCLVVTVVFVVAGLLLTPFANIFDPGENDVAGFLRGIVGLLSLIIGVWVVRIKERKPDISVVKVGFQFARRNAAGTYNSALSLVIFDSWLTVRLWSGARS